MGVKVALTDGWVFGPDGSRMELRPHEVKAVNYIRLIEKLHKPGHKGKVVVTKERDGEWRARYSITE